MHQTIARMLDANFNRVREGLRVVEEISRLVLEDQGLQQALKVIRHAVAKLERSTFGGALIGSRDVAHDPGIRTQAPGGGRRAGMTELARANFRRAQEGLRVIEEVCKMEKKNSSAKFQTFRFKLYALEQKMTQWLETRTHQGRVLRKRGKAL